jgi:hypothetical protein
MVRTGEEDRNRLERRLRARRHTLMGDLALKMGAEELAIDHLRQALAIDPGERGAVRIMRNLEVSPASP